MPTSLQASPTFLRQLVAQAAAPYRSAGRFAWHFARGKLAGDPVFAGLLAHGVIPSGARVLDIGCGQGLLAAWLLAATSQHQSGAWPEHWPAAPDISSMHGIELTVSDVQRAQRALVTASQMPLSFEVGDMRSAVFGKADVVVLLDVLHYISHAAQDEVLRRVRDALAPQGTLVLRVGDAAAGWRFRCSVWVDGAVCLLRGRGFGTMHHRTLAEWHAVLQALGFAVQGMAMDHGTPFANTLLLAKLSSSAATEAKPVV